MVLMYGLVKEKTNQKLFTTEAQRAQRKTFIFLLLVTPQA
jgi:hypothetical protein